MLFHTDKPVLLVWIARPSLEYWSPKQQRCLDLLSPSPALFIWKPKLTTNTNPVYLLLLYLFLLFNNCFYPSSILFDTFSLFQVKKKKQWIMVARKVTPRTNWKSPISHEWIFAVCLFCHKIINNIIPISRPVIFT